VIKSRIRWAGARSMQGTDERCIQEFGGYIWETETTKTQA